MAGKRVLVVDCDPQANATVGLGFTPENAGRNMYDVFMSGIEGLPETRIGDIIKKTSSGIDLAPSHLDLVGADPYLYRVKGRTGILMRALMGVKDRYDLILIDTPPSIGQLVINGLYAADHIIVTLDSGTFALDGISTLATIFSDIREDLGKDIRMDLAIVTRWGEGLVQECPEPAEEKKDLISLIRDIFSKKPEPTPEELKRREEQKAEHDRLLAMMAEVRRQFPSVYTIPYSPMVYESQKRGLPISHFAPGSSTGVVYKEIANEVMIWI
jgi:chromosome partitioning protein